MFCVFIDFKQAFDSVSHEGILEVLKHDGHERTIIDVIERLYADTSATVKKETLKLKSLKLEEVSCKGVPYHSIYSIYS